MPEENLIDYEEEAGFPKGMVEFTETVIEDEKNIPPHVRSKWWGFLGKDTILTRSEDKESMWDADNDFAIRRNLHLMSQPAYKNDITELVELDNVRRRFMSQHKRSIGGFERQALMTQIRELRTNKSAAEGGGGFWQGIKGKLGFGPKSREEKYAGAG